MKQLIFLTALCLIPFLMNAQHDGTGNPTDEITTSSYGEGANTDRKYNSHFGYRAGFNSSTGEHNSHFGYRAGYSTSTGGKNTCLGVNSGLYNKTGTHNTYVGTNAGLGGNNSGSNGRYNVYVGNNAGYKSTSGGLNTYVGRNAGYHNTAGARNVFIGASAGQNELGSDKLYIENSLSATPLIYGNFATDELTIHGNLDVEADANALDLKCSDTGGWNNQIRFQTMPTTGNNGFTRHIIADHYGTGRLLILPGFDGNSGADKVVEVSGSMDISNSIEVGGSVLIGNPSVQMPIGYKLYVEEGILAEKVKVATVNSSDWADYVFAEDYDLNTTEEVETFIKENNHLPNVPSAKEVSENGVDMVEMDATLLRQIEELWLHVIELKKENDTLKEEVKTLKSNK